MRKLTIYDHYAFGYRYFLLRNLSHGISVHGEDGLLSDIDDFFHVIDQLGLEVTKKVGQDLNDIADYARQLPEKAIVDAALADRVEKAVNKLDATLDAELRQRYAYILTPKRFREKDLLNTPEKLFTVGVFDKLSDMAKYDFREACRCIAFDFPTAAAFHLMRGTESVLNHYYRCIVKQKRLKKPTWNPMIEQIRKRKKNKPPKTLIDHLDNIRHNFRNPTQHPEATYDIEQSEDLLFVCIDVVNRMVKDMHKRSR